MNAGQRFYIRPLMSPFRRANASVLSPFFSALFFYLSYVSFPADDAASLFFVVLFSGIGIMFMILFLAALFGREFVHLDLPGQKLIIGTEILGIAPVVRTLDRGRPLDIVLTEIAYRQTSTPFSGSDPYFIVYLVFEGNRKQAFTETTDRKKAVCAAERLSDLLGLEWTDNTG